MKGDPGAIGDDRADRVRDIIRQGQAVFLWYEKIVSLTAVQAFAQAGGSHLWAKEDTARPAELAAATTDLGVQDDTVARLDVQRPIDLCHLAGYLVAWYAAVQRIGRVSTIVGQIGTTKGRGLDPNQYPIIMWFRDGKFGQADASIALEQSSSHIGFLSFVSLVSRVSTGVGSRRYGKPIQRRIGRVTFVCKNRIAGGSVKQVDGLVVDVEVAGI
ncbi:unnamed protein product, partial [marine sediment metagenome]